VLRRLLVTVVAGVAAAWIFAVPAQAEPSAGLPSSVQMINLQQAYEQALPTASTGPPAGVVVAADSPMPFQCGLPCPIPMTYKGGPVQHNPQIYLLLWGPGWSTDTNQATAANYLVSFYQGLGVAPQDTWSTILSQYGDSTGAPSFGGPTLAGTYVDTNAPPIGVTNQQIAAEADAFAGTIGITGNINAQVVVATQSGTCPLDFMCGGGSFCAWHNYSDTGVPFISLPYDPDVGSLCYNFTQYGGFSINGSHEYAETITDPNPYTSWADQYDYEVGDKCQARSSGANIGNVTLYTGTFPMQALWDNSSGSCVMAPPVVPFFTPFYTLMGPLAPGS
jgi:hypothetical protein